MITSTDPALPVRRGRPPRGAGARATWGPTNSAGARATWGPTNSAGARATWGLGAEGAVRRRDARIRRKGAGLVDRVLRDACVVEVAEHQTEDLEHQLTRIGVA